MKKEHEAKPWEKITRYLSTLIGAVLPPKYHRFTEKRFDQGISYFFHTMIFTLLMIIIILAFQFPALITDIESEYNKIEKLEVDVNMTLTQDITLAGGKIRISEGGNYSDEHLFISNTKTIIKPLSCIFFEPSCALGGDTVAETTEEYGNLVKQRHNVLKMLSTWILLSLPTLILLYLGFIGVKTMVICLIMTIILQITAIATRRKSTFLQLFLISIYAGSILLITEPIGLMLQHLYYIDYLAFLALSLAGFFTVSKGRRRF